MINIQLSKYLFNNTALKHFFIYSGGAFFLKVISLIIVPLNLRKLSPADYGIYSLLMSFIAITTTLAGMGLRQVLSIEYFHCKNNHEQNQLINTILTIYSLCAVPLLILLFALRTSIISLLFFNIISETVFIFALIIIFLSFFVELFYQLLQYKQYAIQVTTIQITTASLISALTIIFVWHYELSYKGPICAQVIGYSLIFMYALFIYLKSNLLSTISIPSALKHIWHYVSYGFPFILRILFSWVLIAADKWILGYYISMQEVGIYAIADLFGQLMYFLIIQPWEGAYIPYIMTRYKEESIECVEHQNSINMIAAMGVLSFLLLLSFLIGKPLFFYIFPASYYQAINQILILVIGQIFLLGSNFASCIIQFHKRTYVLLLLLCIPAITNIILNFILIPVYGMYGASFATLLSYILYWIMSLYWNRKILSTYRDIPSAIPDQPHV